MHVRIQIQSKRTRKRRCSPVAALTLMVSPYYAFGTILLVACALSSIYVKRHTAAEFIAGATFTVAALFLSMAIMGVL